MGEIKQGNDGNWYERTPKGWVPASDSSVAPARSGPPSSGMARDALEGFLSPVAGLADQGKSILRALTGGAYPPAGRETSAELVDRISEATADDPTRSRVAGEGLGGAALSLPILILTGGASAPAVAASMAGGVGGALASDQARRSGAGPLGQFGAGLASDIVTGGLARGLMDAPSLFQTRVSPSGRAGRYVEPLGLGPEGADDAANAIRTAYQTGADEVRQAYDAYEAIPAAGRTSASAISQRAAEQLEDFKYSPEDIPSITKVVSSQIGDEVDIDEIRKIRRGAASAARNRNLTPTARQLAGDFVDESEAALMEIAKQSPDDAASAKALLAAIGRRKQLGQDFPQKSGLFRMIIDADNLTPEDAQNAFTKFIRSQDRDKEIAIALNAVKGDPAATRGLKKALVLGIMNSAEETAGSRVSSRLDMLDKAAGTMKKVLGEEGFRHFRKLLAEQASGNRNRGFIWRLMAGKNNPAKGIVAGSVLGGQMGGPEGAAVGAVVGSGADLLAQTLSPRAVREIAIESFYDPELYRRISRPVPKGADAQEWLSIMTNSLLKQGVISQSDIQGGE